MGFVHVLRRFFGRFSVSDTFTSSLLVESVPLSQLEAWVQASIERVAAQNFNVRWQEYIRQIKSSLDVITTLSSVFVSHIRLCPVKSTSTFDAMLWHDSLGGFLAQENDKVVFLELKSAFDIFDDYLVSSGLKALFTMKLRVDKIVEFDDSLNEQTRVVVDKKSRLVYAQQLCEEKRKELHDLELDPFYFGYSKDADRLLRLREEELSYVSELKGLFTTLSPLLSEFISVVGKDDESLVNSYFIDSANALVSDENLSILRVFEHVRSAVLSGKVGRGLEQVDFMLLEMKRVPLAEISQSLLALYREFKKMPRDEDVEFRARLDDVKYRHSHFADQVEALQGQIREAEFRSADFLELRNREASLVQNMAERALNVKMQVVFLDT